MKKCCLLVLCIVIALFVASCANAAPGETAGSAGNASENAESFVSEPAVGAIPEELPEPPVMLTFDTPEEIYEFGKLADLSDEEIEEYRSGHPEALELSAKSLKEISENIKNSEFPKDGYFSGNISEFGGTYYSGRNELDLIYSVDGIRYRFVYAYNKPEYSYSGYVIAGCGFGSYVFDLYEGDECFVGAAYSDTATVRIVIYSKDPSSIQGIITPE